MQNLKSFKFTFLLILLIMAGEAAAQSPIVQQKQLYRKPYKGNTTRPQVPGYRDYITYTVAGTMLDIAYPANALPATVSISGAESGFILYSTTALREEPIDLPIETGDYILTVTLVDDRTYEGSLEISSRE